MSIKLFPAQERGHFNFGWLDTNHTFSFGHYFDPEKTRFGMLRVFNDDVVEAGEGFGTHPHDNMEIISIPLEGTIMHKDSTGVAQALTPGEVQVMSAGTGITHSEYNGSQTEPLKFLQIWIIPESLGVEPRYDQKRIEQPVNSIKTVVGPKDGDTPLWLNQQAWLSLVGMDAGSTLTYDPKRSGNGTFIFVVSGAATVNDHNLQARDAAGFADEGALTISADQDLFAIVIDVPMS